jgi:hypothetical protein
VKLNKWFFLRDAFFLLLALLSLVYATMIRKVIDMEMAISFVVMYCVYVVTVLV